MKFTVDEAVALNVLLGVMWVLIGFFPVTLLCIFIQRRMHKKEYRLPRTKEELQKLQEEGELERRAELGLGEEKIIV